MAKDTYALLVGIIDYDESIAVDNDSVVFPALKGCVNDTKKMHAALQEIAGSAGLFVRELLNEQATKENICRGFLEHLGRAKEGDSVLFYYSGHGTQEKADPCWTTETDGRLEALACYYTEETKGHFLLADKELRYLLNKVAAAGANITVILDCCHSGDATRNAEILAANYDKPIPKRSKGAYAFSKRAWRDFIFHEVFKPEDIKGKSINTLLPEPPHILFSAAESDQTAFEVAGEGIFTKHLISVLNATMGYLSNQALYDRLALSMRYAYEQTPRVYTPGKAAMLRTANFLDGRPMSAGEQAVVFYNNREGWIVNRGELSGLHKGMPDVELTNPDKTIPSIKARVREVKIDHAMLDLPENANRQTLWLANLQDLSCQPLRLFPALDDSIPADAGRLMKAIGEGMAHHLKLVGKEGDADYTLQHLEGMYYLTRPGDKYRPVSKVVTPAGSPQASANEFVELAHQLKHLSAWTFVHQLSKPLPGGAKADTPLSLEYAVGKPVYKPLGESNGIYTITIDQWNVTSDRIGTSLYLRLKNRSTRRLYVTVLYLDINYSAQTVLLEPAPWFLDEGNQVGLNVGGNEELPVYLNLQARYYNLQEYTERLKIIVSDKPFEVGSLLMTALPTPPLPGATRSIDTAPRAGGGKHKVFEGFYIVTVDLLTVNPTYNQVTSQHLTEMLESEATSLFAEALYLTVGGDSPTGPFDSSSWRLRPEIKVVGQPGAPERGMGKSLGVDLANWYARRKRNRYYENIIRRFPGRTRIVSEGDSWFQHPLVYDIIDHLSKVYAIHCVAAAADTLSNYLSGAKNRGEYFLDILEEDKPPVFLISGGGNDILGPQFKGFLVEAPYGQGLQGCPDGSRFLKASFGLQIDKLMEIYTTVFGLLKTKMPQMITIVHGYDYPVHLDYKNKGWLGRYMIEKGIASHADRRTVIRYIMDTFNTRLAAVAAQFPATVRYLDLRGTVLYREGEVDQWYDEIHPDIDGFQSIGLKFIKLIEEIKTKK